MSEFATDEVQTDPSTVDPSATTSPATDAGQSAEDQLPFHKHPRWQERTQEIQGLRAQNQHLTTQFQQLQERFQKAEQTREAAGRVQPSAEEQEAAAALERLIGMHPKLKNLLNLAERGDQLVQGYEQVSQTQLTNTLAAGDDKIASFVGAQGLPTDAKYVTNFQTQVGLVIKGSPQAEARLRAGDLRVVDEACKYVLDNFVAPVRQPIQRQADAALGKSKSALSTLPPRPTGSVPGGVALPKPVAGDTASQRGAIRARHDRMRAMVDELPE